MNAFAPQTKKNSQNNQRGKNQNPFSHSQQAMGERYLDQPESVEVATVPLGSHKAFLKSRLDPHGAAKEREERRTLYSSSSFRGEMNKEERKKERKSEREDEVCGVREGERRGEEKWRRRNSRQSLAASKVALHSTSPEEIRRGQ